MKTEIKTLKDNLDYKAKVLRDKLGMKTALAYRIIVILDNIDRAEAVKWVEKIENNCPPQFEHYLGEVYGLVKWIKYFFNLTEEEIKGEGK